MKILNELVDLANKANAAGQGTPEMVEFRVVANPDNTLAIAEAFRELEQRAEAAEAYSKSLNDIIDLRERDLRAADAEMAERARQKPIGWLNDAYLGRGVIDGEVGEDDFGPGYIPIYRQPLYDRPTPVTDLTVMCDRQYIAGLQAGFILGDAGDNEGLNKATENYRKQILDSRNDAAPAAEVDDYIDEMIANIKE